MPYIDPMLNAACNRQPPDPIECRRCDKLDDPVYLDNDGKHICGDCWQQDRAKEPQSDPMPWELGT